MAGSRGLVAERRTRREVNTSRRWAAKYAAASTTADVMALEFDRIRLAVKRIGNPVEADRVAGEVAATLRRLADRLGAPGR